jgi:3-hydroxybutyryl-CoA dehydrogenase
VSASEQVAVLGAGTMGHGIAQVAAMAGYRVALFDVTPGAAERGLERVEGNLAKGVALGKVEPTHRDDTLGRLRAANALDDALAGADLIIEAAPEQVELKQKLLRQVEPLVGPDTLLATNTSSLSIATLAAALERPGRFLGLHFFNPVHLMALVEVVWGPDTKPDVLDRAVAFVRALAKEPVVVKDSPGFASSRLGVILGLEAMRMVEEGVASPADIDRAMELGYRHPMGPLRLTDVIGLDVRLDIARYLHEALGSEAFRPPAILERLVAEGRTGQKAGRGFYDWSEEGVEEGEHAARRGSARVQGRNDDES